ncbi:MAG: hypothetical protein FWG03_04825 [Clostridiales bacterium]|nr:hypothetical protein [Clostridiales bacterium]
MENGETRIKTKKSREELLELLVVIMLGVTAILTAWSSWVSGLHGSNQAENYTTSNNLSAEGNSEYNAAMQNLMQDMMLYNEVNGLMIDLHFAESKRDAEEAEKIDWKIEELITGNMSDAMADAFDWAMAESAATGESVSPFDKEGFVDSYFETANDLIAESDELLAQGNWDNGNADAYALSTVIFSVVLFLLGISGTFKSMRNKRLVLIVAGVAFVVGAVYMASVPMPTGFNLSSFFSR